jgi:hypothetical protein
MKSRISLWLCKLWLCLSCVPVFADMADINRIFRSTPQLDALEICHGGGCAKLSQANLTQAEWDQVARIFSPMPMDASAERALIAKAIAKFEVVVGNKVGTHLDKAGTFNNSQFTGQQDCNDEAINTTTYLRLLVQAGLVKFHLVEDTRTRHFFFSGWPHTTAVIRQLDTQARYAVDSWFFDNGQPATIVPFEVWKDGYIPEGSPVSR